MSWLFSEALMKAYANSHSSQERAEAFSAATCSDGEPCAQLNVTPTQQPFWRNDKPMDASRLSRFGLTLQLLTADRGAELLTWFLAGFPVRTLVSRGGAQGSKASGPDFGESSRGWFAKFDPDTCSWKTAQRSLLGGSELFSETWPRSGSMRNGECFQRPMLERHICANESGLWQTPVADDAADRKAGKWNSRGEPKLSAQVILYPTPTTKDVNQVRGVGAAANAPNRGTTLGGFVRMWPTPKASDGAKGGPNQRHGTGSMTLPAAVRMFPTATASKGWSKNHNRAQTDDRLDYTIEREAHESGSPGRLSPEFCEWLMGWPIGWTALEPLAMDKFREWQQQHSFNFPAVSTA